VFFRVLRRSDETEDWLSDELAEEAIGGIFGGKEITFLASGTISGCEL